MVMQITAGATPPAFGLNQDIADIRAEIARSERELEMSRWPDHIKITGRISMLKYALTRLEEALNGGSVER